MALALVSRFIPVPPKNTTYKWSCTQCFILRYSRCVHLFLHENLTYGLQRQGISSTKIAHHFKENQLVLHRCFHVCTLIALSFVNLEFYKNLSYIIYMFEVVFRTCNMKNDLSPSSCYHNLMTRTSVCAFFSLLNLYSHTSHKKS